MNHRTTVYLRADGNPTIGLGHVHRLLALSDILKDFFECKFIIRSPLPGIKGLILETSDELVALEDKDVKNEILDVTRLLTGQDIVVLDGYHFLTPYQRQIKAKAGKLICIDDIHETHFVSDVIINPAGGIREQEYSKEPYTHLYSGPEFALLKKPFRMAAKKKIEREREALLICMGGADPNNHTLSTLKECLRFPFEKYYVVIGEAYVHKSALVNEVKKFTQKIEVLINLTPTSLAEVMTVCGTAVCSASGIAYEYLSIGGELYIIETAANQRILYNYLLECGAAYPFDKFRVSPEKVHLALLEQKKLFDGDSDKRILKLFHSLDFDLNVVLRKAKESDLLTLFAWANDSEIRHQSYNTNPISLTTHTEWFTKKINDPSCYLYIFEYKNQTIGQVRIDVKETATISYSIDKQWRGRGWGVRILQNAIKSFAAEYTSAIKIVGYVKYENIHSNKIFENLGFVRRETNDYPHSYMYEYQKL